MRRYCPICDGTMPTGRFCKTCKQFVKPKEDNGTYYLNESHTDTRAHSNNCDFHQSDNNYDTKTTYTINKNNNAYNNASYRYQKTTSAYEKNLAPKSLAPKSLAPKPFVTKQSNTRTTKKKSSKSIVAIIIVIMVLVQFLPFIFAIVGSIAEIGNPINIDVNSDYDEAEEKDEYKEFSHEEVIDNEYKCNMDHTSISKEQITNLGTFDKLGFDSPSLSYYDEYVFFDDEEGDRYYLKEVVVYEQDETAYMQIDFDSVTGMLHSYTFLGMNKDEATIATLGVIMELGIIDAQQYNDYAGEIFGEDEKTITFSDIYMHTYINDDGMYCGYVAAY